MKLYEIKDDILKLLDIIESELPEEIKEEAEKWLDTLTMNFEEKAFNIARYCKNLDAQALACKNEKDRLAKRQKAAENKSKGLKQYLEIMMNRIGKEKISDMEFTLAFQNNPPSVDILEPSKVDTCYDVEQERKLDKKKILSDLKEIELLEKGCSEECTPENLCKSCKEKLEALKKKTHDCKLKRTKSLRIR